MLRASGLIISLFCQYVLVLSTGEISLFDFKAKDIEGNIVDLEQFRGKVVLVVNVASECGFTDNHYKGLVQMQKQFDVTEKFVILAFPCNQFGAQEPKDEADIFQFARDLYGVNFPMFSKVNVQGNDVPDLWKFLIEKSGNTPTWNFWKYLVSYEGHLLNSWGPWTDVEAISSEVQSAVEKAVAVQSNVIKMQEVKIDEIILDDEPVLIKEHDEM